MSFWMIEDYIETDLFLEFSVLLLRMDKVKNDVKCASEDKGEEEREPR